MFCIPAVWPSGICCLFPIRVSPYHPPNVSSKRPFHRAPYRSNGGPTPIPFFIGPHFGRLPTFWGSAFAPHPRPTGWFLYRGPAEVGSLGPRKCYRESKPGGLSPWTESHSNSTKAPFLSHQHTGILGEFSSIHEGPRIVAKAVQFPRPAPMERLEHVPDPVSARNSKSPHLHAFAFFTISSATAMPPSVWRNLFRKSFVRRPGAVPESRLFFYAPISEKTTRPFIRTTDLSRYRRVVSFVPRTF